MRRDIGSVERSVPVQTRVDIRNLAELDLYWRSQGYDIRSMSQLVSWTVDLCVDIISNNELMPKKINTVEDAFAYLNERNLIQRGIQKRFAKKLGTAMRFDNWRSEGIDPREMDKTGYNTLHNKNSVKSSPVMINKSIRPELEEIYKEREREREEEQRANIERQKANAMRSGRVVGLKGESETVVKNTEKYRKRDEEIANAEMMPPPADSKIDGE